MLVPGYRESIQYLSNFKMNVPTCTRFYLLRVSTATSVISRDKLARKTNEIIHPNYCTTTMQLLTFTLLTFIFTATTFYAHD